MSPFLSFACLRGTFSCGFWEGYILGMLVFLSYMILISMGDWVVVVVIVLICLGWGRNRVKLVLTCICRLLEGIHAIF